MANLAEQVKTREYALALIVPDSDKLMGISSPCGVQKLPRIEIPKWTRVAEEINEAVRIKWGLTTLMLQLLPWRNEGPECVVAEIIEAKDKYMLLDLSPHEVDAFEELDITPSTRNAIRDAIGGSGSAIGPFSRRGWLREAKEWIKRSLGDGADPLSGEFHQYNASESFALVQFEREEGRPVWLKATGDPNRHEFDITVQLSRSFPNYLPRLVAVRADWNAWLTEDGGTTLGGCEDLPTLLRAIETLAELQIESLGQINPLRMAGCRDRGLHNIQTHLAPMFEFLEVAMRRQVSTKSKPLTPQRLREIAHTVDQACTDMLALEIPPCLVNGDINLDNILFDGARYRFIDWAEGGIGNPFLTLQQAIQHIIRDGEHQEWVPALCEAYRKKWLPLLSSAAIDQAFALMPLLTIADYLFGRGDWFDSGRRAEPSFQSFARTLGRCMDCAATKLSDREVLES